MAVFRRERRLNIRSSRISILLILLLLVSCASKASIDSEKLLLQSRDGDASATPSQTVPPAISVEGETLINFEEIDRSLLAEGAKLDVQFKTESTRSCRYTMQYPQVHGLANTALQTELNRSLRQNMIEQMKVSGDLSEGAGRCLHDPPPPVQGVLEFRTWTTSCETHFAEKSLVSLSCDTLTLPGAYPNPEAYSVTFDLTTGKIYQLAKLFKPNSSYVIRMTVALRDAWWETEPWYISFPFETLETEPDFDFYFQEKCDEVFGDHWIQNSRLSRSGSSPRVCMVLPNLGAGVSRNYKMPVRMTVLKEILDARGALSVLTGQIDD